MELGVFHHLRHPVVNMLVAVFDPPVEVLGILLLVVEGCLRCVVIHPEEMKPREVGVERVANNHNDLVGVENGCLRHAPGAVRLNNPDGIVTDVFTTATHHL